MQKITTTHPELQLVGISTRTNNKHIFASNVATNKIAETVQKYFHNGLAARINNRKHPGKTYCVYTEYESDANGDYTYFIGEEVTSFGNVGDDFTTLNIPIQNYAKFTNEPAPMPAACIEMWKKIWTMNHVDLGGKRLYIADFEVYDERSSDHNNVILDIYIGIK